MTIGWCVSAAALVLAAATAWLAGSPEDFALRDAAAQREAEAAIGRIMARKADTVWPLLRHSADPALRTYLVHDLGLWSQSAKAVLAQLEKETDVTVRRALVLALGGFRPEFLPPETKSTLVPILIRWYRSDPDPGLHSSLDWLLRHGRKGHLPRPVDWQQAPALAAIDKELGGKPPDGRNWYVTGEGHTMALIHGPVEFAMGSPEEEPGREQDETQHRRRIPRSFAMATKEVTIAQFRRFLDAQPEPQRNLPYPARFSPDADGPQISVSWYDAARYCNWLSRQEGIPRDEWVYPGDAIGDGMVLPPDHLRRTGYRLPTEAEWEFAARAGAGTSRFFGFSPELLREYAWYNRSSRNERTWPVGQLKPNDLGLFDVLGNVWEWCHSRKAGVPAAPALGAVGWKLPYPTSPQLARDVEDTVLVVRDTDGRVRRGGSFIYGTQVMRSAQRGIPEGYPPNQRRDNVGFRVARTWPPTSR